MLCLSISFIVVDQGFKLVIVVYCNTGLVLIESDVCYSVIVKSDVIGSKSIESSQKKTSLIAAPELTEIFPIR